MILEEAKGTNATYGVELKRETPGADPENLERGGRVPYPALFERKLQFSGDGAYSIVGVFVMQSEVTLTFQKIE